MHSMAEKPLSGHDRLGVGLHMSGLGTSCRQVRVIAMNSVQRQSVNAVQSATYYNGGLHTLKITMAGS